MGFPDTLLALVGQERPAAVVERVKVGLGCWVTPDKRFGLCGEGREVGNVTVRSL